MVAPLLICALLTAEPTAEELAALKKFRGEFVSIATRDSGLKPFAIAKYEVTQELWQAVMDGNPSKWKGPRNSVEMVSLEEAKEFCGEATRLLLAAGLIKRGEVVRLPTEEEWEFAARAGTKTKYSFGDDAKKLGEYGWFNGNAAGNDPPVGAKKPNGFGLYDMHGYLWEWALVDPEKEKIDAKRGVVRGGSWKDAAEILTSDSRQVVAAGLRDDAVGLRCVLVAAGRGAAAVASAEPKATVEEMIVPAGAKLEMLWGEGEFTEGPALASDGSIFFSDIGETIYRHDPETKKTTIFRRPSGRANGLMFNQQGDLIACEGANTGGNRRISITSGIEGGKDGTVKALAEKFEGKRFNSPNDLAIDSRGRVYFSDPRYVGSEPRYVGSEPRYVGSEPRELDFEAVYLVTPDGKVTVATHKVSKPNGIELSPDGKTAYVSDNNPMGNRHLVAFDVKPDGLLANKRVLHDFGTGRGVDGMTIDTRGNIYATAGTRDKAGVYIFDPDGKQLAVIPTPGDPTNCVFGGGDERSTLYVTCANSREMGTKYGLYAITLNAVGYHVVRLK